MVDSLERFMHKAYLGQKQFSIEGLDMTVPMLDEMIQLAAANGAREVVIGMAHRGRLNVLAHCLGRAYETIFREFEGASSIEAVTTIPQGGTGDVKYHHGAQGTYQLPDDSSIIVRLESSSARSDSIVSRLASVGICLLDLRCSGAQPARGGGSARPCGRLIPCDGPRGEQGARPTRRWSDAFCLGVLAVVPGPPSREAAHRSGPADQAPGVGVTSRPRRRRFGAGPSSPTTEAQPCGTARSRTSAGTRRSHGSRVRADRLAPRATGTSSSRLPSQGRPARIPPTADTGGARK